MKLRSIALAAALSGGVLAAGVAGAIDLPAWLPIGTRPAAAPAAGTASAVVPVAPVAPSATVPDYRAIVQRFGPAVVGVTVAGVHAASLDDMGLPPGARGLMPFLRDSPGMPQVPFRGQGSGFIVDADGLILTNAHVVNEAKTVTVRLADRREFTATVIGADPVTDVAVLRIDARGLPAVQLGDPATLEVGDPVLAIGAPFGLEQTATQGIVSAKGRSLPGDGVVPFLQTDAAVNPGNSGGPLFDGRGAVVGINSQIYSQSGGYQGLSFAIPIDVALKVKDQLVRTGRVTHARLGVAVQDLTQPLAESFGLPRPDGALVSQVLPGSAAAGAGLKAGDVITEVDGKAIERSGTLSSVIGLSAPGESVRLKVWRDRRPMDLAVRLGASERVAASAAATPSAGGGALGLALRPMHPREREQLHADQGLLVQGVEGPAERAGVEPGDVLLAVNGQPLTSVEQLRELLRHKPKRIALLVQREGERIFMPVQPG